MRCSGQAVPHNDGSTFLNNIPAEEGCPIKIPDRLTQQPPNTHATARGPQFEHTFNPGRFNMPMAAKILKGKLKPVYIFIFFKKIGLTRLGDKAGCYYSSPIFAL